MSNNTSSQDTEKKGGDEKMVTRSISIELSMWKQAQRKAGFAPLSAIIRALVRKWLAGEIKIEPEDTNN